MANRYFIQEETPAGWIELDTRPLYSKMDAMGFIANLRQAPAGNWSDKNLRVVLNGLPIS